MRALLALTLWLMSSLTLGSEALIDALEAGDSEEALTLLEAEEEIDLRVHDETGRGALHLAARIGATEVARLLIQDFGTRPNVRTPQGNTPLHEAVLNEDLAMTELLLRADADPDAPDEDGRTPLMRVARTTNTALAHLLLEHGADPNAREIGTGRTALMWSSGYGHIGMMDLLLQFEADPDAQSFSFDWDRRVSAGPDLDQQYSGGFTSMLFAARENCQPCVELLLEAGADIDLRDADGTTPLVLALLNRHFDLARFLIEEEADVNLWDWWGRGPLYAAVDMSTAPTDSEPPSEKQDNNATDIITLLLNEGANPNLRLKYLIPQRPVTGSRGDLLLTTGTTPLLRAAMAGDVEAVRLLLEHGADPSLAPHANWREWFSGVRPLAAAAGLGYQARNTRGQNVSQEQAIAVIDLLTEHGAKLNAQDDRGRTALHGAVMRGWSRVIEHLVAEGADPGIADEDGHTPLDMARGKAQARAIETFDIDPDSAALLQKLMGG